MKQIDSYIFRQMLTATLVATGLVTLVIWLAQSLRLMELVLDRGAPFLMFLWLMVVSMPTFLGLVLPLGAVVGVMFIYYRLINDNELVVMRAAGMSHLRLVRPALMLCALVTMTGYFITIHMAPAANRELVRQEFFIKNDYALVLLRDGMFNPLVDGITVYVRGRDGTSELRGLLMQDNRIPEKPSTLIAEKGFLMPEAKTPTLVLLNGKRQEFDRATHKLSELSFESYSVDLGEFSKDLADRWQNPRERTMYDLLHDNGPDQRPQVIGRLTAEFHNRLAAPLLAFCFTLVALALLLPAEFNRRGMIGRMVFITVIIVMMQSGFLSIVNLIPKQPVMVGVLYAITLLPIIASFLLLNAGWRFKGKKLKQGDGA